MNYAKINKFKTSIIVGSFAVASIVAVPAFFYGIKSSPEQQQPDSPAQSNQAVVIDLKIKGNRKSKIYHSRGCPNYDDLKETNIIWFKTTEEAEARGFRAARNC